VSFRNDNPFAEFELAEHLRDCILPFLEITTQGLPNRVCITTGEIAWDDCECGQLVISTVDRYESGTFPNPWTGTENAGTRKCGAPLFVYHFRISMLRCSPVGDDMGNPPPCEEVNAAARITSEDAWAVRTGLLCCLCEDSTRQPTGLKLFERYTITPQVSVGPRGACQGTELDVFIGVPNGAYPCGVVS
jgi:hypothetical protein